MTNEDRIRNTGSFDRTTVVPLAKFREQQILYPSNKPFDKWGDEADSEEGQTTVEQFADAL